MTTRFCLILALLTTTLAAGSTPRLAAGAEDSDELAEKTMPELKKVVQGNTRFALDLYARLRTEQTGNLFFSPSSVSTALAMTQAGARSDTEREMAKVLHFPLSQNQLPRAFAALNDHLHGKQNARDPKARAYQLHIANRLWGQAGYGFLPEFLEITRQHYDAELAEVDFARQAEPARQEINTWVEQQTQGRIEDLLPPGVLDSMTRLVLTNAIYFKGDWAYQFEKQATREAPFWVSERERVNVPLMFQKERFKYQAIEGVQVLELPYAGEDLSMLVLLPQKAGTLAEIEKKLTADTLNRWTAGLRAQQVEVYLHRFTMTSEFQLADVLQAMGMQLAFDPKRADFSGMNGRRDLFLSAVVHKAFVDVNEEGTEAAAATGAVIGVTSVQITPTFRADHPFVFYIRDNQTGSILFLGRVANPKG